jgi:hypothetical protein
MANYLLWFSKNADNGHYQTFRFKDGFVLTDNLSEILDSGTIVLNKIPKQKFEPFDIVELHNNYIANKTMLIDNVAETQVSFNPERYDYVISLMSKTKELERIVLPNFSVTRPISASGVPGTAKTIREVIETLLNDYCPRYFIANGYTKPYRLSHSDNRINQPCPDMQMSRPTLREAIDRILSSVNCICKLNAYNVIELFDINQKNNEVDMTYINYKDENQGSGDYASVLDNVYNNVVPSTAATLEDISNTTEVVELLGFRDESNGIIAEDNLYLETKFPIYNIKSVIMFAEYEVQNRALYEKQDITNYVKEARDYAKLDFGDLNTSAPKKANSVYYTRGDNKILNFSNNYKKILFSHFAVDMMFSSAKAANSGGTLVQLTLTNRRKACAFLITYWAEVPTVRASSGKLLPETHENSTIIDNPGEAFVDIYQQGNLFKDKVNRLGNRVKIINGRFPRSEINKIPKLGDYIGNFIVINTEIQYFDDFVVFKGYLSENFVNINYFTGINARKRTNQIVSAEDAFDKVLLKKYYCEFSFEKKQNYDNRDAVLTSPSIYDQTELIQRLGRFETASSGISYVPVSVLVRNQYVYDYDNRVSFFELELQKFISGNSIILTCGMYDNFAAAISSTVRDQTDTSDFYIANGGFVEYWNRYTNDLGNCEYYDFVFLTDYGRKEGHNYLDYSGGNAIDEVLDLNVGDHLIVSDMPVNTEDVPWAYSYQGFKPRFRWDSIYDNKAAFLPSEAAFTMRITNHKDSREKVNFNFQFEYCTDTKDIIFTTEFIKRQSIISNELHNASEIEIYVSDEEFNYGDTTLKGNYTKLEGAGIWSLKDDSYEHARCTMRYSLHDLPANIPAHKSVAIVTATGRKLLMAVNTTDDRPVWYLNILANRDRKVYTDYDLKQEADTSTYYEELTYEQILDNEAEEAVIGWCDYVDEDVVTVKVFQTSLSPTQIQDVSIDNTVEVNAQFVDGRVRIYKEADTELNEVEITHEYTEDEENSAFIINCANGYVLYNETGNIMSFIKRSEIFDEDGYITNIKYGFDMEVYDDDSDTPTVTNVVELQSASNNRFLVLRNGRFQFVTSSQLGDVRLKIFGKKFN